MKTKHKIKLPVIIVLGSLMLILSASIKAAEKKQLEYAPAPLVSPAQSVVQVPAVCGGMTFDRQTGSMIPRPNVDLIVKKVEINRNDRGTWVKPTIRNRCTGRLSGEIHVSIGDVVVTFVGIPPQTDYTLGYWVGVPPATSYTVIVDYDRRIRESNETNNRCTRSSTGICR